MSLVIIASVAAAAALFAERLNRQSRLAALLAE